MYGAPQIALSRVIDADFCADETWLGRRGMTKRYNVARMYDLRDVVIECTFFPVKTYPTLPVIFDKYRVFNKMLQKAQNMQSARLLKLTLVSNLTKSSLDWSLRIRQANNGILQLRHSWSSSACSLPSTAHHFRTDGKTARHGSGLKAQRSAQQLTATLGARWRAAFYGGVQKPQSNST
jgi:hypothetical protein